MSRSNHDTPYADDPRPAAPSRHASKSARPARKAPAARKSRQPQEALRPAKVEPPRARPSRRRRRGGGGGGAPPARESKLTSQSTSRAAYVETRQWLLEQHGPVCAYCARRFTAGVMTLDHVAPRRGMTAYDRRDNLVLACPGCNAAKRDLPPAAYLLGSRQRAANLLRYGSHLSPMLLDLARSLSGGDATIEEAAAIELDQWGEPVYADDESPYRD